MPIRFRRAEGALWRYALGSVLVHPRNGSDIVALAGTGVDLWDQLVEPASADELAVRLGATFDRPADVIIADIAPVLEDLVDRGVIERDPL